MRRGCDARSSRLKPKPRLERAACLPSPAQTCCNRCPDSCSKTHRGSRLAQFRSERTAKANAAHLIATYHASVEEIENSLGDHKVLDLIKVLKRKPIGAGPYPCETWFEASNRILSDLVVGQQTVSPACPALNSARHSRAKTIVQKHLMALTPFIKMGNK